MTPVFRYRHAGPRLRLYPLVCLHLGAQQADVRFIKEQIARIKSDPDGRWVYMGDGGECVTKLSKGDVYTQLLSPQEQLDMLVDLLRPIQGQGLFAIRGNHGHRIYKETGLEFDQSFATAVGLPYLGVCAFAHLTVGRTPYTTYWHHGADSGTSLQSKIKRAEDFARFVNVDAIFTAHSHVAMDLQPAALIEVGANFTAHTRLRRQYICGSAYDSRSGYATEKGFSPILPSWLIVEFDGRVIQGAAQRGQSARVVRAEGSYELAHEYVPKYRRAA